MFLLVVGLTLIAWGSIFRSDDHESAAIHLVSYSLGILLIVFSLLGVLNVA